MFLRVCSRPSVCAAACVVSISAGPACSRSVEKNLRALDAIKLSQPPLPGDWLAYDAQVRGRRPKLRNPVPSRIRLRFRQILGLEPALEAKVSPGKPRSAGDNSLASPTPNGGSQHDGGSQRQAGEQPER